MTTVIIILILNAVMLFVVYRMGRDSEQKSESVREAAAKELVNEILQKQRDGRVSSVDDADRLFDTIKKD